MIDVLKPVTITRVMSDEEIVRGLNHGDREKFFNIAMEKYGQQILGFIKGHGLSEPDEDEVFQETFLAVCGKFSYRSLKAFLFTVARRRIADKLRSKYRREREILVGDMEVLTEYLDKTQIGECLKVLEDDEIEILKNLLKRIANRLTRTLAQTASAVVARGYPSKVSLWPQTDEEIESVALQIIEEIGSPINPNTLKNNLNKLRKLLLEEWYRFQRSEEERL